MSRTDLVKALRRAVAELDSAHSNQLAGFLAAAAADLEQGKADAERELRRIFAPGGDWDKARGDRRTGDTIYGLLQQEFECRICIPAPDESAIRTALALALPSFQWEEGDSSWDKIRVWGERPDAAVSIYRYESPGPFRLRIRAAAEGDQRGLLDQVLLALQAKVWKPLEPQPVSLIQPNGRFPAAYEFECDLGIAQLYDLLTDSDFWYWELLGRDARYIEGRIPFRLAGKPQWNAKERVRLTGDRPSYKLEVGHWPDAPDRIPTCSQVHEIVQNTILPALAARNVRAAA